MAMRNRSGGFVGDAPGWKRRSQRGATFTLLMGLFAGYTLGQAPPAEVGREAAVQTQMRNVVYHYTDSAAVYIKFLGGEIVPTGKNELPIFDDKESFTLRISAAEISMAAADLGNVLNSYVFAGAKSPLSDISTSVENGKLKIKGKLREKGNIPFETDGLLTVTAEGKIRLHTDQVKALHLPVKGLMELFGIEVSDLIKSGKVRGLQTEENDLIMDLQQLLPPPHLQGKVTSVDISGTTLVVRFGDAKRSTMKFVSSGNYMSYRGNRLRFGKLTMVDTDMTLVDMDPADPFDFYLDRYKEQLAAGYSKITPTFGLRVFMKDFNKLRKPARLGNAGGSAKKDTP
ncbi:MAG: hypothetical protein NVS9B4_18950 [Candidatus Acidiferrum sp.]